MFKTLYGLPSNTRFVDVWDNEDDFLDAYKESGIYQYDEACRLSDEDMKLLYYLIYSRYGNSSIASDDRNRFAYRLFDIVYQYGPTWVKKREIQNEVRNLTPEQIAEGSGAIYNHAFNPGTAPSTATLNELPAINDQNTTKYKKGKVDALMAQWELLNNDVTNYFLNKFEVLFTQVTAPWYGLAFKVEDEE